MVALDAVADEQFAKLAEVLGEYFAKQHLAGKLDHIMHRIDALAETVERLQARIPHLVSIGQAAQALQVSERTIRRWVRERKLSASKIGAVVRIDLSSVTRLK